MILEKLNQFLKANNQKIGGVLSLLVCIMIIVGFYNSWKNEISLNSNKEETIGRVTKVKYGSDGGYIEFKFYVGGKLYEVSDPDDSGWPTYVRNDRAKKNMFYPVEFDSKDPKNSKILITRKPLGVENLLSKGIKIEGEVENIYSTSDSYADLHVKYTYLKGQFKFRTRLHQDSLPCGTLEDCQKSKIDLVISKDFPDINDLYYLSYDRIQMKKAKRRKR